MQTLIQRELEWLYYQRRHFKARNITKDKEGYNEKVVN